MILCYIPISSTYPNIIMANKIVTLLLLASTIIPTIIPSIANAGIKPKTKQCFTSVSGSQATILIDRTKDPYYTSEAELKKLTKGKTRQEIERLIIEFGINKHFKYCIAKGKTINGFTTKFVSYNDFPIQEDSERTFTPKIIRTIRIKTNGLLGLNTTLIAKPKYIEAKFPEGTGLRVKTFF